MSAGWIAVDLDGTLARYEGWQGIGHIGEPIAPMVERVKRWLSCQVTLVERLRGPNGSNGIRREAAERIEELERDLLKATSIGIATITTRCGPYESLSPYLKGKCDELWAMHAKCDAAFNRNAAMKEQANG